MLPLEEITTQDVRQFKRTSLILEFIRHYSVFLILLGLVLIFSLGSDQFLTASNLQNIALQTSIIAIVVIGMTFVILAGGIDLSVGSVVAFGGALAAGMAVRQGLGTFPAIAVALLTGALFGVVNGLLIVKGKIAPICGYVGFYGGYPRFNAWFTPSVAPQAYEHR